MTKLYIDLIEDENGDQILPLPEEVRQALNIGEGSEVTFNQQEDGSIVMKRKHPLKMYAVESITSFRNVYFIMAETKEHAMDEVVCNQELTYFQQHLDEVPFAAREVTHADMVRLIQETEQPEMTLEKLETGKWLQNCVNTIDYTK